MGKMFVLAGAFAGMIAAAATAATTTFDVRPLVPLTNGEVVVQPGETVEFELVVRVDSDSQTADNQGLDTFQIDVDTNAGVTQQPMTAFADDIKNNFPLFQNLGTIHTDKPDVILGIAAAQSLGGESFTGVGVGGYEQVATGVIITPNVETTFSPICSAAGGVANAVGPPGGAATVATTLTVGPGFTIRTQVATPPPSGGCGVGMMPVSAVSMLVLLVSSPVVRATSRRRTG
jgi:hypothetical protein